MSRPNTTLLLALATAASTATAQSLMLTHGEVVQSVGDAVPGLPGVTIAAANSFSTPIMDLNGNMLWRGQLTGPGITAGSNDFALFHGRTAADLTVLLQRGAAEPSGAMPGVTVTSTWDSPRLSAVNGHLLFGSGLAGAGVTTSNDTCFFWGQPGALQLLAREGDPAPSPAGAVFTGNMSATHAVTALSSSGLAVIKVKLTGGGVSVGVDDDGWLFGVPGSLSWMCRESDLLPGGMVAVGALLDGFDPAIDEVGRVLFPQPLSTSLGSTPATTASDSTIMLYTPGQGLSIVMREGDPAAGSGSCVYGTISSGSGWSDHGFSRATGWFTFTNSMTGGDVTGNMNDTGIFAGQIGGSIARIAREAEIAPTGVPGETYQTFFPNGKSQINDNGTVCFIAQLGPTGSVNTLEDVAVFRAVPPYGPGDVTMILREGDPVDGLPAGWEIWNPTAGGMTSSGTTLLLNERDAVLISIAGVGDPLGSPSGQPALIAWDPQHGARVAIRGGETYTIQASAQVHTIHSLVATSSGDGGNLSFNNNGDYCSRMSFTGTVPAAILRGHVGSLIATPSSISAVAGGTQNWVIDCGPAQAFNIYVVLGSTSGTRPGLPSPFGPQTIPLNFDAWTQLSLSLANTGVYANSLWFLDAQGRSTASFNLPPSLPGAQGLQLHHAVVVLNGSLASTFASEPSALRLY